MKLAAVFFDAVGTLLHPDPPAATIYSAVGQRHGSRLTTAAITSRFAEAFDQQEQADRAANLATSEAREIDRWRRIVADVLADVADPEACFQELFHHFAQPAAWRLEADAACVLQTLAERGLVLGMASNFDRRLRAVLAGFPELAPIRHLAISSEIGWRKPSPRFFAAAVKRMELPPPQILLVGDDPVNDYDGASAAGMRAMLFDPKGRGERATRIRCLTDLLQSVYACPTNS